MYLICVQDLPCSLLSFYLDLDSVGFRKKLDERLARLRRLRTLGGVLNERLPEAKSLLFGYRPRSAATPS